MYPHYILESSSIQGRLFDHLGYCGVCRKLAFSDNNAPTNPTPIPKHKPYPDSKINNKYFNQCGKDTL